MDTRQLDSPGDEVAAVELMAGSSPAADDSGVVPAAPRQREGCALCLGSGSVYEKLCLLIKKEI